LQIVLKSATNPRIPSWLRWDAGKCSHRLIASIKAVGPPNRGDLAAVHRTGGRCEPQSSAPTTLPRTSSGMIAVSAIEYGDIFESTDPRALERTRMGLFIAFRNSV
jgi:hypothetical protein